MAVKNVLPALRKALSPSRKFSSEGERVLQSQMMEHGPGSLFLSPVKWMLDKASPKRRFGSSLSYGAAAGPEAINRRAGEFFKGVPGLDWVFKRKITPGEVGEAAGHLKSHYGYSPKQISKLLERAGSKEGVHSYRLTAPLEGAVKRMVLPMAGGAYIADLASKRRAASNVEEAAAKNRLGAIQQLAGINKEGELVVSSQKDLMVKAASTIEQLTRSNKALQDERQGYLSKVASLERELLEAQQVVALQKEAMALVAEGTLDPSQIEGWVDSNMTKTSSEAQSSGHIPKYAFLGQLDESNGPHNQEAGGSQKPLGITAHQAFATFLTS